MKKVFSIRNVFLMLVVVLIGVLSLNIKEAKAAGTVTWSGPSSITIRETIRNITNPIVASREYYIREYFENYDVVATATINYTTSDTPTNYQITKSTTMDLSSLAFTKPGDYEYYLSFNHLYDSNDKSLGLYINLAEECSEYYNVTVSVRNVVDSNNVPTGNFTASLILEKCEYNEQTGDWDLCSKVSPSSGVLYADFDFEANPEAFGHIELSKTVKGIGADTSKYFPFTINIDNDSSLDSDDLAWVDSSGWTYPISGLDATITYNGNTINNPTTITDGTPTTIYLKHGQTAIIGQVTSGGNTFDVIPYGACTVKDPSDDENYGGVVSYKSSKTPNVKKLAYTDNLYCYGSYFTVEETPGDYTPSFSLAGYPAVSGYSVSAAGVTQVTEIDFYNEKTMSPVTGLIFTILPYLILAGIGVGGTLLVMHLKKEERKVKE